MSLASILVRSAAVRLAVAKSQWSSTTSRDDKSLCFKRATATEEEEEEEEEEEGPVAGGKDSREGEEEGPTSATSPSVTPPPLKRLKLLLS